MSEPPRFIVGTIGDFARMISGRQRGLENIANRIAQELGFPDETELRLKDREANKPDSRSNLDEAIKKIKNPIAVYYSFASMHLVFVNHDGEKIGIRSVELWDPLKGEKLAVGQLIEDLKEHSR